MGEEVGELMHAFLKSEQGIRTNEDHRAGMVDAIGDLFIFAAHFCELNNIDMQGAVNTTWAKVKLRDWTKNKTDGVETPTESAPECSFKDGDDVELIDTSPDGLFTGIPRRAIGEKFTFAVSEGGYSITSDLEKWGLVRGWPLDQILRKL